MHMVERQPLAMAINDTDASFIDLAQAAHVSSLNMADAAVGGGGGVSFGDDESVEELFLRDDPLSIGGQQHASSSLTNGTPFYADATPVRPA
jgi:hypothetical protein